MTLFGAIQMAGNTLRANEIALQVVGQNIANANTPGYIREEVLLAPAPTQRLGGLLLGMGVQIRAVVQKLDTFLEQRLRNAVSEQANTETLQQTYGQLEGLLGELSETDLSTAMNNFFASIAEILNQPESRSVRNLAMLQGDTLAKSINRVAMRATELRADINKRVQNMAADINRLVEEIRVLNVRVAEAEGGDISSSDAVGLRDQRLQALENLSKLLDIEVTEQGSGGVAVYVGGNYLVFEGTARSVEVVLDSDRGLAIANIHLAETDSPLNPASGQLRGLIDARDAVLGSFLDRLDAFAKTLIFDFNRLYSSGQGLVGFREMTSQFAVDDKNAPLNEAGLPFMSRNGSFQVMIHNKRTGLTQTTDVFVDLNGLGPTETTLASLAASLDAINGLRAEVTPNRKLMLRCESPDEEFTFGEDTSGVLAALGLNIFFSGTSARDIGVDPLVRADPARFAASRGGIGADTNNAVLLAGFLNRPLESQNGASLGVVYDRLVGEITQGASVARAAAEGATSFALALRGQKLAISGVNLDEEAVRMIGYQRAYQAAAKYIAVLSDLFEILVSI
jgi:flagellar hook-associated protein 1 FlgK